MNELEVKKELFKSKEVAKISHYVSGNLYYTVKLEDGVYQFPISTTEDVKLDDMPLKTKGELKKQVDIEIKHEWKDAEPLYVYDNDKGFHVEATCKALSSDLGTTTFSAEMRGSELNRWIAKAIKSGDFIKISE
jgi:hypothetical protein